MLRLFDLILAAKSFRPIVGLTTLSIYLASDSDSGAAMFGKMARGNWTECGIAWDNIAGDDKMRCNNPKMLFFNDL